MGTFSYWQYPAVPEDTIAWQDSPDGHVPGTEVSHGISQRGFPF